MQIILDLCLNIVCYFTIMAIARYLQYVWVVWFLELDFEDFEVFVILKQIKVATQEALYCLIF